MLKSMRSRPELDFKQIMQEAIAILRRAPPIKPVSRELIRARAILSDGRSRLVDFKVQVVKDLTLYRGMHDDLEAYLWDKFAGYLGSIRNQHGRDAVVVRALTPVIQRIRRLESVRERIDEIIKDHDARSYAIRDVIEALRIGEREIS